MPSFGKNTGKRFFDFYHQFDQIFCAELCCHCSCRAPSRNLSSHGTDASDIIIDSCIPKRQLLSLYEPFTFHILGGNYFWERDFMCCLSNCGPKILISYFKNSLSTNYTYLESQFLFFSKKEASWIDFKVFFPIKNSIVVRLVEISAAPVVFGPLKLTFHLRWRPKVLDYSVFGIFKISAYFPFLSIKFHFFFFQLGLQILQTVMFTDFSALYSDGTFFTLNNNFFAKSVKMVKNTFPAVSESIWTFFPSFSL